MERTEINAAKAAVRQRLGSVRIRPEERCEASAAVLERIQNHVAWQTADTVLLYAPLPDELDLMKLAAAGKRVCFPRYQATRDYTAAYVETPDCLVPGKFGILEPAPDAPEVSPKEIDAVIVPGVAFDAKGHRLGRGRGFYDRWLQQLGGILVGVGFDHQLIDRVPHVAHDIPMHFVATPSRWICAS